MRVAKRIAIPIMGRTTKANGDQVLSEKSQIRLDEAIPFRVPEKWQGLALGCTLFFAGLVLCWLRAPDSLINPILYTEDAVWTGQALQNGWADAFINAKPGYLVWGNILLLWLSSQLSVLACGDAIVCMPETVSFVSYGFYAGLATILFFAAPKSSGWKLRLAWYLAVFLLPLGETSNEIFGRISNIGYYVVALTAGLMLLRSRSRSPFRFIADAIILLCVATNPAAIVVIGAGLVIYYVANREALSEILKRDWFLIAGTAILSVWIAVLMAGAGGTRVGEYEPATMVEVVFARSVLYPFVFPFYDLMSDGWTLALMAVLVLLLGGIAFSLREREKTVTALIIFLAFLSFWAMTILLRPSLTQQLVDYSTTFPDRYFAGINLCLMLLVFFLVNEGWRRGGLFQVPSGLLLGVLAILYMNQIPVLFEITSTGTRTLVTFRQQICLSATSDVFTKGNEHVSIPVEIYPMEMTMEARQLAHAYNRINCRDEFRRHFYVDDVNWKNGMIRTGEPRFILPAAPEFVTNYVPGKIVQFPDGEKRRITSVHIADKYWDVTTEGGLVNMGDASALDIQIAPETR